LAATFLNRGKPTRVGKKNRVVAYEIGYEEERIEVNNRGLLCHSWVSKKAVLKRRWSTFSIGTQAAITAERKRHRKRHDGHRIAVRSSVPDAFFKVSSATTATLRLIPPSSVSPVSSVWFVHACCRLNLMQFKSVV